MYVHVLSRPVFLNPIYPTTRFLYKKFSRPTTEGFYHLQAFLKATFIQFLQKGKQMSFFAIPATRLKSSTTRYRVATRRLRNAGLDY